jgi:hypothetical protein
MSQRLKLSTMTEKRLKMSRCGQFKSLWHRCLGQSFLLVLSSISCESLVEMIYFRSTRAKVTPHAAQMLYTIHFKFT